MLSHTRLGCFYIIFVRADRILIQGISADDDLSAGFEALQLLGFDTCPVKSVFVFNLFFRKKKLKPAFVTRQHRFLLMFKVVLLVGVARLKHFKAVDTQ